MDHPVLFACAAVVFAGTLVQGTSGIGFGMLAAPVVALLRPDFVPAPMIAIGGVVSLFAAIREARHIERKAAAVAVGGRIPGSILAGLVIGLAPRAASAIAFALLIVAALVLLVRGG